MGRKSHHKTRAHADRKPDPSKPVQPTRREREALMQRTRLQLEALLRESKIERMTQAEILEGLTEKYPKGVPVPVIWGHLADRRITIHGAGPLAARG